MDANQVIDILNQLASKLTPSAQHVWDLAVRQMIITNGVDIIAALIALIAASIAAVKVYQWAKKGYDKCVEENSKSHNGYYHEADPFNYIFPALMIIAALGAVIIVAIFTLINSIPVVLNPEWNVLMQIKSLIPTQ
jgi:hypothetical protein